MVTDEFLNEMRKKAEELGTEFLQASGLRAGELAVIGCSTSEISSRRIGSFSSAELGCAVFEGFYAAFKREGVYLAAQCCEHLNRALILEAEAVEKYGLEPVNVVPMPKAGGSFATAAYGAFAHPVAVEHIRAAGGIDVGDTLIGMHIKDVAVPLRLSVDTLGGAHVVCARTRPKFIGGERAHYDERLK